jgi:hypothetical protein
MSPMVASAKALVTQTDQVAAMKRDRVCATATAHEVPWTV